MTLDTRLRIFEKVDPEQLWPLASGLAKPIDWEGSEPVPEIKSDGEWVTTLNPCGVGYNAWVFMYVNTGAEMSWHYPPTREDWQRWHQNGDEDDMTWDQYVAGYGPACWVELSWDTAYGYWDTLGRGCSDLHRDITEAVGKWLDDQGIDWMAQNEFTGEWAKCPMPNDA